MFNPILTDDGSFTLYSDAAKEHYHSMTGAREEAFKKYIQPMADFLPFSEPVFLFDFCFGMGYNTAAAIDYWQKNRPRQELQITGIENDRDLLNSLNQMETSFSYYDAVSEAARTGISRTEMATLKVLCGDALTEVSKLNDHQFHGIFFDPFSPPKQPEMWSFELFQHMYRILKNDGVLATYSAAPAVREKMKLAGLTPVDGPCVGRKTPSTLAFKRAS